MEYTTITSQEQYDRYKKELHDMKDTWQLGAVDAKMKINRIEKLCLEWRNKQERRNNKTEYSKITSYEQYQDYKQVQAALMSLAVLTPAIMDEIKLVTGLLKDWETNKKEQAQPQPTTRTPKRKKA